jgi:hypothetical protein
MSSFDPFDTSTHTVQESIELSEKDLKLVNCQRLLVNYLLNPTDSVYLRVPLGTAESHLNLLTNDNGSKPIPMWKNLASEIGPEYYPPELMTDSRSVLLGTSKPDSKKTLKKIASLAALESSEQKGDGEGSPKSGDEPADESDDDSVGADDYNIQMDFEDEGAGDDYDEDDGGGGDYGGEF